VLIGRLFVILSEYLAAAAAATMVLIVTELRGLSEYLRIIYGPEYDAPEPIVRLRQRNLGGKRNLARCEFALGHEALKRSVAREPLRRTTCRH
jgi:protein phosphatase